MLLSTSFKRKVVATCGAALGFALLHEARVFDSQSAVDDANLRAATAAPAPGAQLRFSATAYCKGEVTASGTAARSGIAAADPTLLPVGSVVKVEALGPRYDGVYTVMDTGPAVQGRELDLYMWSCQEALAFGRRTARLTVLRLGWNPRATSASALRAAALPVRQARLGPSAGAGAPVAPAVLGPADVSPVAATEGDQDSRRER
jgi:3D (Asp-Asp-Asp) domain-containing protein